MSVRSMARVWEHSQHGGTDLLMLLAIADFSDDQGTAFPAVDTLAEKCRMKSRNARYILRTLETSGELTIHQNQGPKGSNLYRINLDSLGVQHSAGVQCIAGVQPIAATPATHCTKPLQPIAAEPSLTVKEPLGRKSARSATMKTCPDDFQVTDAMTAWANSKGFPGDRIEPETERFLDYHRSKGNKFADWQAAWRNWISKSVEYRGIQGNDAQKSVFEGAV